MKTGTAILLLSLLLAACNLPSNLVHRGVDKTTPQNFSAPADSLNSAKIRWKDFFRDPYLNALIDTALRRNQELNIMLQEINVAQYEVQARKGEYLPFVHAGASTGIEKVSRYTSQGAADATSEYAPGKKVPENLQNYFVGFFASWEVDIWKKLRNAKKSAMFRYLATTEGKNYMVTGLVYEIANSYYELMALDNELEILKKNIEIQQNALEIVKLQKQAALVTELAVRKFEAEVLKNQSRIYYVQQEITETENRINFLLGRYPQAIERNSSAFNNLVPDTIHAGIPSQLLEQRPDIRRAEMELEAAKLDVQVAKAAFYPSLNIMAGGGFQAFNVKYFLTSPQSLLYNIAGDLVQPLINRNAIKAKYYSANAKQIQAIYEYERSLLNAFIEVQNQLSMIRNLQNSYELKAKQVQTLTQSIDISSGLFKSARANYMEVLMTQRDALESKVELIETKRQQMSAVINLYKALGGGWN